MRWRSLMAALLVAFSAIGCTRGIEESSGELETPRVVPSATPAPAVTPSTGAEGKPPIVVRAPLAGDEVGSPLVVRGTADVAAGHLLVQILGADGTEVAAIETVTACATGCRGAFRTTLAFFVPRREPGRIVVSGATGDDSTSEVSVDLPVTLLP